MAMHPNAELITGFYTAFRNKDYKTMQQCYADDATFSDAVFADLNAEQVRAMWEMLVKNGRDLKLEFSNVTANETNGSAEWIATYTFSKSGNKVVNRIKAEFTFANGKIKNHRDHFSLYKWASQALGVTGLLLGWSPMVKSKVKDTAMKSLNDFMAKQKG